MTRAIKVIANDDYSIMVTLEDGRVVYLDMTFIKNEEGPVIDPLKQVSEFQKAFVRNGIVSWPTGYDIDPYFLIEHGVISNKSA